MTCDVDIFELKPETKNQKLKKRKEFQFGIFLNKSFKKKCFDIRINQKLKKA